MELVDLIYKVTDLFPNHEMYSLSSQIRRAAISLPSNIAEGSQRNSKKEFKQFIGVAYASLAELETQAEIAFRQKYISEEMLIEVFKISGEVGKMLNGLSGSLDRLPAANCELQTLEA